VADSRSQTGLARGAAVITAATAVSRITGFIRVLVVAAAMGTTFLANTYQTANTAPNLLFELVAAGVLTSVFVPTFVDYLTKGQREEGWRAANALTSVALLGLVGISLVVGLAAPLIMRLLTIGVADPVLREQEIALGTKFLWLFSPQIVLYGAGMIMTSALHAHRSFKMPAIAPILNNVVVIAVYAAYAAMRSGAPSTATITGAEIFLLGAGTTAGVLAMTVCLIPELRRLGWRFRFEPDRRHPAVGRAMRLGVWALSYAGGYQAGLIVVLVLANRVEGGVAAYQWAYTFFYLPHALFGVPVFHVLFPEMSEHAAKGEMADIGLRVREGLRLLLFLLIPIAGFLAVAARPLLDLALNNGAMTVEGTDLIARTLAVFAIGLPAYSIFLVLTRAFYAMSDTRTPALINILTVVLSSVGGAIAFFVVPRGWEVPALAAAHSAASAIGAIALARALRIRVGDGGRDVLRSSVVRSTVAGLAATVAMLLVTLIMPEGGKLEAAIAVAVITIVGAATYLGPMKALRASELTSLGAALRGRSA
jgi:putative peptidoglycan lipid II flippase